MNDNTENTERDERIENIMAAAQEIARLLDQRNIAGLVFLADKGAACRINKMDASWNSIRVDNSKLKVEMECPVHLLEASIATIQLMANSANEFLEQAGDVMEATAEKFGEELERRDTNEPLIVVPPHGEVKFAPGEVIEPRVIRCRVCGATENIGGNRLCPKCSGKG